MEQHPKDEMKDLMLIKADCGCETCRRVIAIYDILNGLDLVSTGIVLNQVLEGIAGAIHTDEEGGETSAASWFAVVLGNIPADRLPPSKTKH